MSESHPPGLFRRVLAQPVISVADAVVPAFVQAVDIDEALARVDVDELVQRVDVQSILDKVEVNDLIDRIDVDRLLERVDVAQLIDRIGIDALLEQIDINLLLQQVDVDQLIQRIDIDAILKKVDINDLANRLELGEVIRRSTSGVLVVFMDLVRRQLAGVDIVVMRAIRRIRPGDQTQPVGPPALVPPGGAPVGQVSGRYAGPASRLVAFAIDSGFVLASYALIGIALTYVLQLLAGYHLTRDHGVGWSIGWFAWWFLYLWLSLSMTGRTVGKAIVGLRVVAVDGSPMSRGQAAIRVVVLPFSFVLFGLGLLLSLVQREQRSLHDLCARTCQVYDWGDRPAVLPSPLTKWLDGHGAMRGDVAA